MIPSEAEWTKRVVTNITRFFKNRGYKAVSQIVDKTKIETKEGIDAVVIVGGKIIGIQTKRPQKGKKTSYRINMKQYNIIKNRNWIYYAFPEIIPPEEQENFLHRVLFSQGGFEPRKTVKFDEIENGDGVRWGTIATGLAACSAGLKIEKDEEKEKICPDLRELIEDNLAIFSIDSVEKQVRVSVGHKRLIDGRIFKPRTGKKNSLTKKTRKPKRKKVKCDKCGNEIDITSLCLEED